MLTIGAITLCLSFSLISGHELTNAVELLEKIVEILKYSVGKDESHQYDEEILAKIDKMERRLGQLENDTGISVPNPTCAPCPNQTCTRCPDKWIQFQSSCYLFVDAKLNWHQAKSNCQEQGAYLVHVNDKKENSFLKSHLGILNESHTWMGLTDADKEGQFKWDGGNDLLPFTDWGSGEPNDGPSQNEDCAHFNYHKDYTWNDTGCKRHLLKSICEMSV